MSHFTVREHIARCQHSRERPAGAERGRESDLRLHVKQYIPKANSRPKPGDVTIIGAQANGFPKECYEPFWDDVYERLAQTGQGVRGIWVADMATQSQSGIINEALLGPDQSWWDHGRDLLSLINQFQDDMPHPIVGIGHSIGASHLAHLSLMHPRLMHSLVLIDPIIQPNVRPHKAFAKLSTTRRDVWPSRNAAAQNFKNNKFYQQWDSRVLDKWIEYGLRDLPTEQYPDLPPNAEAAGPPVTLTTTAAQEVYLYLRAYYRDPRLLQDEDTLRDIDARSETVDGLPFGMPEGRELHDRLPELKPSVLFVFGTKSEASPPDYRQDKMARTGTGARGSGGAAKGRVKHVVLDCGHLVGMEKPKVCADASAAFIGEELARWKARERVRDEVWSDLSRNERVGINELWKRNLGIDEESGNGRKVTKL